ncbi:DotU family type IV/VI secretion system protein [Martelella alba]|uniref:DotU family type IV/VI secretion system protein n=1 Tax=Martelella alba TaxID=2590451 RepID=UPI0027D2979E|nr:DotU family type IV/VI secretion system protein [Martelella alba]
MPGLRWRSCALLDEAVMNRKSAATRVGDSNTVAEVTETEGDEGARAWRAAPLQARYFGSLRAGGALYDRIAEVLRQPSPVPAVLACYQRVLALGFQGQFSLRGECREQREKILASLNARVPPLNPTVSLVVHETGKRRCGLLRSLWFWIVLAVMLTTVAWISGYLWLQALLRHELPELH